MSDCYTFYAQQVEMSNRILSAFTSGEGELYGLLLAQMQSGKSGTYFHLAIDSVHRGIFDKVYIICGSRDTSLRDQTKDGLSNAIESFCSEKATGFSQGMEMMRKFQNSIQVFWNQELDSVKVCDRCLIINDESHTASSKTNIPYKKFWKKSGLSSCLHGDFTALRKRNIRVLSVSATSFSECVENQKVTLGIDIKRSTLSSKNVFMMDPGPTYTGVPYFLQNGNIIFASEPICEKTNGDHLRAVLMDEKYACKYCIVRTARASLDTELVRDIADRAGVIYKPIHGEKIKESLDFLKSKPRHTTLVHICGIARMGQELDKTHIGFVYEQSKNPAIDTLLQGLLGRVCGHNANPNVDIFVSKTRENEIKQYADAVQKSPTECVAAFSRISPALNVKKTPKRKVTSYGYFIKAKDGSIWKQIVPVKFMMNDLAKIKPSERTWQVHQLLSNVPSILGDHEHKDHILSSIIYRGYHGEHKIELGGFSEASSGNNKQHIPKIEKCIEQNKPYEWDKSDDPGLRPIRIIYSKDNTDVYIVGYAPAEEEVTREEFNKFSGISDTLKKCNYNPAHVVVTEAGRKIPNVNGGQLIVFPRETAENDGIFYEELKKAVHRSMDDKQIQREIMSIYCNGTKEFKGIRLCKHVFTQDKIDAIKKKIEEEFSIKLKFTYTRGRQPTGYFQYSSISW
mgnify:CR=1 FL=1